MRALRTMLLVAGSTALFTGCMHHPSERELAGDITVDSLSASRTVILRVDNSYPSEVRFYTLIGRQKNYVAKAMPDQVRTWVMDPSLFPAAKMSFVAEVKDGSLRRVLGPFKLDAGDTVEMVVTNDFDAARATIHRSTR